MIILIQILDPIILITTKDFYSNPLLFLHPFWEFLQLFLLVIADPLIIIIFFLTPFNQAISIIPFLFHLFFQFIPMFMAFLPFFLVFILE